MWQKCSDWFRWKKSTSEKRQRLLSGGQRQRIAVARAYFKSGALICDESFLTQDILTQSQLLELLEEIQRKTQLSYCYFP